MMSSTTTAVAEQKASDATAAVSEEVVKPQEKKTNGVAAVTESSNQEPATELERKIITQIEYYFGDENLRRDRFLREEMKKDGEGWVSLEVLCRFNRLKALTTDPGVICAALDKSSKRLMQVKESREAVRRDPTKPIQELNKETMNLRKDRTVYVKGFPKEDCSMDALLSYFTKYGPIVRVVKRSYGEKGSRIFKGSVFAQYEMKADAAKYLADTDNMKFGDATELIKKCWQQEYFDFKTKEKAEKFAAKRKMNKAERDAQQAASRASRLQERMVRGQIIELLGVPPATAEPTGTDKTTGTTGTDKTTGTTGTTGWGDKHVIRDNLTALTGYKVAFVDILRGEGKMFVRFEGKQPVAKLALEKLRHNADGRDKGEGEGQKDKGEGEEDKGEREEDKGEREEDKGKGEGESADKGNKGVKVTVQGVELETVRILEGDVEEKYWLGILDRQQSLRKEIQSQRQKQRGNSNRRAVMGKRSRGGGGRRGGKGGRGGKHTKFEDEEEEEEDDEENEEDDEDESGSEEDGGVEDDESAEMKSGGGEKRKLEGSDGGEVKESGGEEGQPVDKKAKSSADGGEGAAPVTS